MASSTKVLSIGLGDLVTARNATLRASGFDVMAVTTMEEAARACWLTDYDVAIVGYAFTNEEKSLLVRCVQAIFQVPVILITDGESLGSLRADSYIHVDAPPEELIHAIGTVVESKSLRSAAS